MNDVLTPLTLGTDTVAVVPACALSWHQVQLPKGSLRSPRLRTVLEGLLEDLLLDEPAQLHFALQPNATADTPVWVAVCNKAWLRDALAALQANAITVRRVVPEWAPTGSTALTAPERVWVTGDPHTARMVWTNAQGVHQLPLPADQVLPHWLPWLHTSPDASPNASTDIAPELWAEPAAAQWAEQLFHRPAQIATPQERLQTTVDAHWDLAQFDLAQRSPLLNRAASALAALAGAPQWRPARWAVLCIVLAQLVGLNVFAWRASSVLDAQRADIGNVFSSTFPKVSVVVDPVLQMQREVAALLQNAGSASPRDLESLLAAYGAVLNSFSPLAPADSAQAAIEFIAGELRVTGNVPNAQQLDAANGLLQAQGFAAKLDGNTLVITPRSRP
jgi:general secretion pathway protein L